MQSAAGLKRALTFWPLLFYGLGVIVGAGIYVATGAVIHRAGEAAPISFLLAGMAAGLTGLCYAELAARFPEAAGAASYVKHGLSSDWLGLLVGAATTLAVAVAAASIAHGAVLYLSELDLRGSAERQAWRHPIAGSVSRARSIGVRTRCSHCSGERRAGRNHDAGSPVLRDGA